MMNLCKVISAVALVTMMAIAARTGVAQNALGDGRLLDANPSRTQGRFNSGREPFLLNRINNDIVTRNVPGGYGFRGDVGYQSQYDFRGQLGSDDLFQFRADSYRSGLALSRGAASGRGGGGAVSGLALPPQGIALVRPGSGADLASIAAARYGGSSQRFIFVDPFAGPGASRTSRSSNDLMEESVYLSDDASRRMSEARQYVARRSVNPLMSGFTPTADEPPELERNGANLYDWLYGPLTDDELTERGRTGSPADPSAMPGPARIPTDVGEDGMGVLPPLRGEDVYLDYIADIVSEQKGMEMPGRGERYSPEMLEEVRKYRESVRPRGGQPDRNESTGDENQSSSNRESRRPVISRLAVEEPRTNFDRAMQAGQEALATGRYFDAERRFNEALGFRDDHPMAQIGRIHAELGAGLYLSATNNLRRFLGLYPEMAGAIWDDSLLPQADRTEELVDDLTWMIGQDSRPEAGLLLAYFARFVRRPDLVRAGLDDLAHDRPDDPLLPFLREIWLAPSSADDESEAADG